MQPGMYVCRCGYRIVIKKGKGTEGKDRLDKETRGRESDRHTVKNYIKLVR